MMERKIREIPFGSKGFRPTYREYRHGRFTGRWEETPGTSPLVGDYLPTFMGDQVTDSESHSWPPPKGSSGDVGGDFLTSKRFGVRPSIAFSIDVTKPTTFTNYDMFRYQHEMCLACPVELTGTRPKWPTSHRSSNSELDAKGATAVSRCKPTSSAAELSVALGETYRDGLPAMIGHRSWQERTLRARNAGDEFLNVEFGWVPLVRDITDFGSAVINSDTILSQYDADKGKVIRRRYSFPDERSESSVFLGTKNPDGILTLNGLTSSPGAWYKKTYTNRSLWFSGAFVYGIPNGIYSGSGIQDMAAKADKLVGLSLTPDTLWNLAPWSWAIDWFSNTGDVLSNISDVASQGLVMQYGYIMETVSDVVEYSLEGFTVEGKVVNVPPAKFEIITKSRRRANPFGFGITWDGLSTTQAAILAALGISRT